MNHLCNLCYALLPPPFLRDSASSNQRSTQGEVLPGITLQPISGQTLLLQVHKAPVKVGSTSRMSLNRCHGGRREEWCRKHGPRGLCWLTSAGCTLGGRSSTVR